MVVIEIPVYVTSASYKPGSLIGQIANWTAFYMAIHKTWSPLILSRCCSVSENEVQCNIATQIVFSWRKSYSWNNCCWTDVHMHNHCRRGHICSLCIMNQRPRSIVCCSSTHDPFPMLRVHCTVQLLNPPLVSAISISHPSCSAAWHLRILTHNHASIISMLSYWASHCH